MDVIGDTELAIQEYDKCRQQESNDGLSYLVVYGILQVLYVQQDAVRNLANVLGLEFNLPQELLEIRDMRNAFTGHPTKQSRGGSVSCGFIIRSTISSSGFQFLRTSSNGSEQFGNVNIPTLIINQHKHIDELLGKAVKHLEEEELEHRRQFRAKKLANAFSQNLSYGYEKMSDGIHNISMRSSTGKWGLENTVAAVEEFKRLLNERGILNAYPGSIVPLLEQLDYPIDCLMSYYNGQSTALNDQDAEVFAFFLQAKVSELEKLAIEVDKEYESDAID